MRPYVICLQETFLKENDKLNIRQHTIYNQINKHTTRASGDTSIIINNTLPQSQINLNTNLQAIAVSVTLHKTISICSLYISHPKSNINELELEVLIQQLLKPFIHMGDFNSHNQIWGSRDTNKRGHTIENFMNTNHLCLLNNESPTYLHPATGTHSVIDLTLSNPTIYLDYNWKTSLDNCRSDHYPIILERLEPEPEEKIPCWNLQKAKQEHFKRLCHVILNPKANINKKKAQHLFHKNTPNYHRNVYQNHLLNRNSNKLWYNNECIKTVRVLRTTLRKFKTNPTKENLELFKNCRARA